MNDCVSITAVQHNAEVAMGKVPMIEIPKAEYDQLLLNARILSALEIGGVDNWEWYSESLRDARLLDEEDEDTE